MVGRKAKLVPASEEDSTSAGPAAGAASIKKVRGRSKITKSVTTTKRGRKPKSQQPVESEKRDAGEGACKESRSGGTTFPSLRSSGFDADVSEDNGTLIFDGTLNAPNHNRDDDNESKMKIRELQYMLDSESKKNDFLTSQMSSLTAKLNNLEVLNDELVQENKDLRLEISAYREVVRDRERDLLAQREQLISRESVSASFSRLRSFTQDQIEQRLKLVRSMLEMDEELKIALKIERNLLQQKHTDSLSSDRETNTTDIIRLLDQSHASPESRGLSGNGPMYRSTISSSHELNNSCKVALAKSPSMSTIQERTTIPSLQGNSMLLSDGDSSQYSLLGAENILMNSLTDIAMVRALSLPLTDRLAKHYQDVIQGQLAINSPSKSSTSEVTITGSNCDSPHQSQESDADNPSSGIGSHNHSKDS